MAILPLQVARVSNGLRTFVAQSSMTRAQQLLLRAQNELTTGRRINAPSDDPGGAAIVQQLRKTLEQRQAYDQNITHAVNQLSEVDISLGDLTRLLDEAHTIASANVGSDVSEDARQNAAAVVQALMRQAMSLANKQFDGVFIFGGDRSTEPPFVEHDGGVQFVGSSTLLRNLFDENTSLPFQVDAAEVFGALSTRVEGATTLTPALSATSRLDELAGASGHGVRLGSIRISNGTDAATLDLSAARSVGDVLNLINNAGIGSITASINGGSIVLNAGAGDDITVTEVGGGSTAADLGVLTPTGGGAGVAVVGTNVGPRITPLTALADLNNGAGVDLTGGLTITNGNTSETIDFSGAVTVEDLLNRINGADLGVIAQINRDGSGIDIFNRTQGTNLIIAENGGTLAADLGLRSYSPASPLSELNLGKGVRTVDGDDIEITRKDGTTFTVDLSGLATVQDVIDAINAADGGAGVTASFATVGNGIVLTDTTGGTGTLRVTPLNFSNAAADLGLLEAEVGGVITGKDVNPVESKGIFGHFSRLIAALQSNDQKEITAAAEGLKSDYDRVVRVRGETGALVQELENRRDKLEDQNLATRALLSSLEDADFTEAIMRFEQIQTSLQASMMTTARTLDLSLLDFLR
jgi:flagellar hook-associated protein 3 FlgL